MQADYTPAIWEGRNTSGLQPYGKHVLVKMDECAKASSGGILLTDEARAKYTESAETGCIVDQGPEAFVRFDDGTRWTGPHPEVGQRIYITRYAGVLCMGMDGCAYRIMDYHCIVAGLTPEGEEAAEAVAA